MIVPETEVIVSEGGIERSRTVVGPGDYVIGRDAECQVHLDVALVSRRHAQLTINYDHALIEDLGSSNGTFVNGKAVTEATRLWPNQKIQVGAATIELRRIKVAPSIDVSLAPQAAAVQRLLPEELLREKKYDIGKVVAQGGMGAILDARDAATQRGVAMKVMLDGASPEDLARFVAEARVTAQLEHPNIVPVHELSVDENGQPFYTMKMVRGITLRKVLELVATVPATAKKYSLGALLTIFQKVCDAIAFAHARGVIHRDLKPENIMLGDYGEVLVMDWGLAKTLGKDEGERMKDKAVSGFAEGARLSTAGEISSSFFVHPSSLTLAGSIMGTPQYMAPEQARGEVETMDQRADIYALGAILYHILALRPSVTGDDAMAIVEKVARGEVEPLTSPSKTRPIPESLGAVCRKAMALDPAARYQSVPALQAEIEAFQNGFATSAEKAGAWKQFTLLMRRNKSASVGIAAVLLVGGVLGTKALVEGHRAARMLGELRGTAPTFEAQSRALLAEGNLDEALAKIGYAVGLAPANADYHLLRAHLLQSTQKLAEAESEYRRVRALRSGDAAAKTNEDLCARLLAEKGRATELPVNVQSELLDALIAQHRDLEAAPLSKLLNRDNKTAEATIRARLASYTTQNQWKDTRISHVGGLFVVNLLGLQLGDLNALRGLPIVDLHLGETSVTDLRPLAGLPLEKLSLRGTHVSDLSPLRGMKLAKLDLASSDVTDLSPLTGMPLKELSIGSYKNLHDIQPLAGLPLEVFNAGYMTLTEISALRGMPLRDLRLHLYNEANAMPDFSAVAHSPALEKISLPWQISDIAFLATLPKLQQVEFHYAQDREVWMPVRDFLARYGPEVPQIKAVRSSLASAGLKAVAIWRVVADPNHRLLLDLRDMPLADLGSFRGLPIESLNVRTTSVRDLEPLRGMSIHELVVGNSKVRNLEPLRGMPLRKLDLSALNLDSLEPLRGMPLVTLNLLGSSVRDVGILADFHDLEEITLPRDATNVELLRALPKLRLLSTGWDTILNRPDQTTAQFWKDYDAKKAAAK